MLVSILENGRHLVFLIGPSGIYLLLLDMSKAFDTVCRNKLKDLQEVLEPDEMHMMTIHISDVVLTVKVGKELGEQFQNGGGNSPR